MSKSITIPSDRGSRITVNINGVEYVYAAGATVTVPDEVAAVIENALAEKPAAGRKAYAPLDAPKRKGAATGIAVMVDDDGNLYIGAADIPTPTTVAANPTLAGTEADLTGLQIGDTKYKVGGDGGTETFTVTCTPTSQDLSGTMDKTPQEIHEAYTAGKNIQLKLAMDGYTAYLKPICFNVIGSGDEEKVECAVLTTYHSGATTYLVRVITGASASTYSTALFEL